MQSVSTGKTLVQCDFDGTVTIEDASFILLDEFADGDWRQVLEEYKQSKISVGVFSSRVFGMVKADKQSLLDVALSKVKVRGGFRQMLDYCNKQGFRLVIVSNGLDFYIEAILQDIGVDGIEVYAARTQFRPDGLRVQYTGPDGRHLDNGFKTAYVSSFLGDGYRVIYIGDGFSDVAPAIKCHKVFATGELPAYCKEAGFACTSFTDFKDVVRELEMF